MEHHVEIKFFHKSLPHAKALFIEIYILLGVLIGTDNGCIPAGTAKSDVISFQYGHIGYTMIFSQKISCCQSVDPTSDNHNIIMLL